MMTVAVTATNPTSLIPRLTAMYKNKELSKELLYCHKYSDSFPVWDTGTFI